MFALCRQRLPKKEVVIRRLSLLIACLFAFGPSFGHRTAAAPAENAAINILQNPSVLQGTLSKDDADRYKLIFALQLSGKWNAADKVIGALADPILLGHVMFQRYMHPTAYKSKYGELKDWMGSYADHPDAYRIYRLAMKRRPRNYKVPKEPIERVKTSTEMAREANRELARKSAKRPSRVARGYLRDISRQLRRGRPDRADTVLQRSDAQSALGIEAYDGARARVAQGYYLKGYPDGDLNAALSLARSAADRSRIDVPVADWTAGISAWRLGEYRLAAKHFAAIANAADISDRTRSSSAFWAARAHMMNRNPEQIIPYLELAATYPMTLYGVLAHHQLGTQPQYEWAAPVLAMDEYQAMASEVGIRRAVGLAQAGQIYLATRELKLLHGSLQAHMGIHDADRALMHLAVALKLPEAQIHFGEYQAYRTDTEFDSVYYPIPEWEPLDGYSLDRAYLFAVMRQESRFNPHAKSYVGARGLMQLMPDTASFVAKDRSLRRRNKDKLFQPEFNMMLGQRYLTMLLESDDLEHNILYSTAAYNAGPRNMSKWIPRTDHGDDPLLFIESLPISETRFFLQRVLENLWVYRNRLDQHAPSLEAVAGGRWPIYIGVDDKPFSTADMSADSQP